VSSHDNIKRLASETRASPSQAVVRVPRKEFLLLMELYNAADGLCYGTDWNQGTAAKLHGYRRKLQLAVANINPTHPIRKDLGQDQQKLENRRRLRGE